MKDQKQQDEVEEVMRSCGGKLLLSEHICFDHMLIIYLITCHHTILFQL